MKDTAKKGIDKMTKILDELEKVSPEVGDIYECFGVLLADLADVINADDAKKFLIEKKDCRNTFKTVSRMFDNMTFKNVKKLHNDTEEKPVEKKDDKKSTEKKSTGKKTGNKKAKKEANPMHSFTSDVLKDPNEYEDAEHSK